MRIPIPKILTNPQLLVFNSFPDFADNAFAFYLYLEDNRYWEKYKFVWLVEEVTDSIRALVKEREFHCRVIKKKSIQGVWAYLRSRHFFTTHGGFLSFDTSHVTDKYVNLWHGMPLKRIGRLLDEGSGFTPCLTIASSRPFQKIMADSFGQPLDRVIVTGQPRCDMMSVETDYFKNKGISLEEYSKVGIWMPTYRVSIVGDIREDGTYEEGSVSFLKQQDLLKLDEHLKERNVLLLLKIHPMDILQNYEFPRYSNIVVIRPREADSELYPILGKCDFLLTDYSSVYIDYEVLERSIGFVMDDLDAYSRSRGFCFDNIEDVMPGRILSNLHEIEEFIDSPQFSACSLCLNEHHDFKSSERLAKELKL